MGYGVIDIERYQVPTNERLITVPITYHPGPVITEEELATAIQF